MITGVRLRPIDYEPKVIHQGVLLDCKVSQQDGSIVLHVYFTEDLDLRDGPKIGPVHQYVVEEFVEYCHQTVSLNCNGRWTRPFRCVMIDYQSLMKSESDRLDYCLKLVSVFAMDISELLGKG